MKNLITTIILTVATATTTITTAAPLKVYLMAGQSNMQGHCRVRTFEHIGMDPQTAPILKKMTNADGTPKVIDHVWITTLGCAREEKFGPLTAGFGAERSGPKIGPELTFGIYMQEHVKEPILIIKTAWGGKSLSIDFRPPSAGTHPAHVAKIKQLKKENKDTAEAEAEYAERTGHYHRLMMGHIKTVLADIKRVYPGYDEKQGYEVSGFMWFQGCNDFGDMTSYPNAGKPGGYDEYTRLLGCMIRGLRQDLKAPNMKAVIGVLGINGELETKRVRIIDPKHVTWLREFRKAMAAPTKTPEFKGNVAAVHTADFWEPQLEELQSRWPKVKAKNGELKASGMSKAEQKAAMDKFLVTEVYTPEEWKLMGIGVSNAAYHYMGSAKIMARIGKAFAESLAGMDAKTK
jgi:hypothetical protein